MNLHNSVVGILSGSYSYINFTFILSTLLLIEIEVSTSVCLTGLVVACATFVHEVLDSIHWSSINVIMIFIENFSSAVNEWGLCPAIGVTLITWGFYEIDEMQ